MDYIKELDLSQVPHPDANYSDIRTFAHRIDGYTVAGSFDRCAQIARDPDQDSIVELRIALFFHFRAMRHTGEEETKQDIAFVRGIVRRISKLIGANPGKP